jgi:hypothetical protein
MPFIAKASLASDQEQEHAGSRCFHFPRMSNSPPHQDEGNSNLLIRSKVVPCMGMWSDATNQRIEIGGSYGNTDSPLTRDEPSPTAGDGRGYTDERNPAATGHRWCSSRAEHPDIGTVAFESLHCHGSAH